MKRLKVKCPYCGSQAVLRPASVVYGKARKNEYLYICKRYPACDAYVHAHVGSRLPMGSLANGDLRHKRIVAHREFDRLWKDGLMNKYQAYKWLGAKFGLSSKQAHIANFSEYMCDQVIDACKRYGSIVA